MTTLDEAQLQEAMENLVTGMTLVVAQSIIATNPWFGEQQIQDYVKARREFYGPFISGASLIGEYAEEIPVLRPAAAPLKRLADLPANQFQQALMLGARAFRTLGRMRAGELPGPLVRAVMSLNDVISLLDPNARGDYFRVGDTLSSLLESVLRFRSVPPKIKTLLRQLEKLRGTVSDTDFHIGADPGAWFDMSDVERADIREELAAAKSYRQSIMDGYEGFEDKDIWRERLTEASRDLAEIQVKAGVNATIIEEEDAEPLDSVLRKERKLQRDGPTEWVLSSLKNDLQTSFDEYPNSRLYMTQRELGKLMTLLNQANTFDTMQRILRTALNRKLISKDVLSTLTQKIALAQRNKAIRDGVPLVPLEFTPVDPEEFVARFDTGEIDFQGEWTEDHKREVLGRVSAAVETLESIFGKGFCGKHAKKLEFRFHRGAGVGGFAKAQYFGWENRNRWQPRVTFSEEYDGLLAHELSHYYEDLLAYRIEDALVGVPAYQYGDVGHGPGDIFGRTGVRAEYFLEGVKSAPPESQRGKILEMFPELAELFQSIVTTADYARWADKVGASLEMTLPEAVRAAGIDPYSEEGHKLLDARYKSELPPEIVADAENRYKRMMDGDGRKLTYYNSSTEVWARMMEQYVYTKLSRAGIANPWLTQLTYDPEVMDQFMAEETFEEQVEPIFDRLFERLKTRGIIAAMARRLAKRWASPRADPSPSYVARRWIKKAGILEAPPALRAKIQDWALKVYAGNVLALVEPAIDSLREEPGYGAAEAELEQVQKEALRYTDRAKAYKSKAQQKFPLDLTGWRYGPDPGDLKGQKVLVVLEFWGRVNFVGLWEPDTFTLHLSAPVHEMKEAVRGLLFRPEHLKPGALASTFRSQVLDLQSTVRHELQHLSQTVLTITRGLGSDADQLWGGKGDLAGLPSRSVRSPGVLPNEEGVSHALRDIEFQTRLGDEVDRFLRWAEGLPVSLRRRALRVWVGLRSDLDADETRLVGRVEREFWVALRDHQRGKWQKGVSEFVKAVEQSGLVL